MERVDRWFELASQSEMSWGELCGQISEESVLRPAHLNQLADPDGQRVIWGNYLLLRPTYHPLGWTSYEAMHARLEKKFRLTFLPHQQVHSLQSDSSLNVLERSRKVASISSDSVVKVIDIEAMDEELFAISQLPEGQRLSEIWQQPISDRQWANFVQTLVTDIRHLHDAGVAYGGLDPLAIRVAPEDLRCRLDFLIANPILVDSQAMPMDLESEEQQSVIEFRKWKQKNVPRPTGLETDQDWREAGCLFQYLKSQHPASSFWQQADTVVDDIQQTGQCTEEKLSAWVVPFLAAPDSLPTVPTHTNRPEILVPSATDTSTAAPQSFSQKRQVRQTQAKRKSLTLALALVAPLPIVLIGLLAYFQMSSTQPAPQGPVAQQPVDQPLPSLKWSNETLEGPETLDDEVDASEATQRDAVNKETSPPPNKPSDSADAATTDKSQDQASGKSPTTAPQADSNLDNSSPQPGSALAADLPTMNSKPEIETPASPSPDLLSKSAENPSGTDTNVAANEPTAATTAAMEPAPSTATFTFEGLRTMVDLQTELNFEDELSPGASLEPAPPVSLGQLNSTTALKATFQWQGTANQTVQLKEVEADSDVRRWALQQFSSSESAPRTLAYLRATTDRLELSLATIDAEILSEVQRGRLQLTFKDDPTMSHQVRFFQPQQIDPLPFQRGAIRGVVWETPALAGEPAFLELSLHGQPFQELPADSPRRDSLNLRRGERFFFMGEQFEPAQLGLVVKCVPGNRTRFQAKLVLIGIEGLAPFEQANAAAVISQAANQQKQIWQNQYDARQAVRAENGEAEAKKRQLEQLDSLMDQADQFRKKLEPLLENGEAMYDAGLDVRLYQGSDSSGWLLLESAADESTVGKAGTAATENE